VSEALLTVRDVQKVFAGVRAVEDFSLELFPGEIVGLIGPNGAGKSTAINLISGVHRPTSGQIWFAGTEITHASPSEIARLGLVRTFQHIRLFRSLTVRQNVESAAQAQLGLSLLDVLFHTPRYRRAMRDTREAADDLLRLFALGDVERRPAGTLAYGDQRRVEIVRSLATRPRALLLDEPAAGMNDTEAAALAEFLRETAERYNLAVLLIEHHLDVIVRLCQRVIVLDHGAVIASGTPDEVTREPEVIRAYLGEAA
jgi:ABC-type branched-subunit amino acid transport system ATPase component